MSRYVDAEWVPWRYLSDTGQPTYFKGTNQPTAVVLHIMQGYMSTARQWALTGHYGASWHFSVGRDGKVMQHLDFADGGYHAGIPDTAPKPTWSLWRGHGRNVNTYTIGIEHEGFSGDGFTEAQRQASKKLCQWLAMELDIPYARVHFPPHADIDVVNRVNDFGPPDYREEHYRFMFEEGDAMTPEERVEFDNLKIAIFAGSEEGDIARMEKVILANYRMMDIAEGRAQSVSDRATSAVVLSKRALAIASAIAVAGGAFGAAATQVLGG